MAGHHNTESIGKRFARLGREYPGHVQAFAARLNRATPGENRGRWTWAGRPGVVPRRGHVPRHFSAVEHGSFRACVDGTRGAHARVGSRPTFMPIRAGCGCSGLPRSHGAQVLPTASAACDIIRTVITPRHALLLSLLLAATIGAAAPPDAGPEPPARLRIGLSRAAGAASLRLAASPGARLFSVGGAELVGAGPWTLRADRAGITLVDTAGRTLGAPSPDWRIQADEPSVLLGIALAGGSWRRYRGALEVTLVAGRMAVVNEVALEDYLRGVIGAEMGGRAPLEALKAQAVAARTYALYSRGRWQGERIDLRDTTDSQVYSGADGESGPTDQAVQETAGMILTQQGVPIPALFAADCGGRTAPFADESGTLASVDDSEAHGSPDASRPPNWSLRFTPAKLAALVARSVGAPVGWLLADAVIAETDVSGRVKRLRITYLSAKKGSAPRQQNAPPDGPDGPPWPVDSPSGDPPVPGQLGPDSRPPRHDAGQAPVGPALYREISGNTLRSILGANTLRSTLFKVRRDRNGDLLLEGWGWGHGHGLCQVGAMALASAPRHPGFREILNHYYPGATIARLVTPEGSADQDDAARSAPALPVRSPTPGRGRSGHAR